MGNDKEEPLWTISLLSPSPGVLGQPGPLLIRATTCSVGEMGELVVKGGKNGHTVKTIVAPGLWLAAERQDE